MTNTKDTALKQALEALEEIALAGMSGTGQESKEAMTAWHARQAWKFIGIAARALEPIKQARSAPPVQKRPQNCETGYCSCIECVMEPAPVQIDAWPCVIAEADFEQDTITLKMECSDYKVGAGQHWLHTTKPSAQPAVPDAITGSAENPEYRAGWNECRETMLQILKARTL